MQGSVLLPIVGLRNLYVEAESTDRCTQCCFERCCIDRSQLAFDRQREPVLPDVVRARSVELIDAQGVVRGTFGLINAGKYGVVPRLVMRDADGRDSIEMGLDIREDGELGFASDHWNEGAVELGHLTMVDDGTASTSKDVEYKSGAWGLRVRSVDSRFTGVGFLNSGRPIVPLLINAQH